MGKTIFTPKQLDFLELASVETQITKNFYLTGGTALAEFYLKHRLSEDLDFFSERSEVNPKSVEAFLQKIAPRLKIKEIKRSQFLGLVSFLLIFQDKNRLKVDFSYYPFPRIDEGAKYRNLEVDGIYDIATNKLHTLFMKPRTRDYIDLYFILKEKDYSLPKIIIDAKAKFDWDIDRITLASQFTRLKDFTNELPKMLKPFDFKKMEDFYLGLAKQLEDKIFL